MSALGCDNLNLAGGINAGPIVEWATAIWTGFPARSILRLALSGARQQLAHKSGVWSWSRATTPAHAFLLTLDRIGWSAASERSLRTHTGFTFDLLRLPPAAVHRLVLEATAAWEQRDSVGGGPTDVVAWKPLQRLGHGPRPSAWTARHLSLIHI